VKQSRSPSALGVAIAEAATDSGVDTPHGHLAERRLDAANLAVDDDTPPPTAATPASDAAPKRSRLADLPSSATQTFVAGAAER
jgi:hypothetical protein